MKFTGLLIVMALLCACTEMTDTANRAYDDVRAGVYNTTDKIQEWTRYNPPSKTPQAPDTRYCYKALTDIICYDTPQPKISNKLIGYQGVAPANMPSTAVNFGPATTVTAETGPFYVNHSPYVTDSGEMATSSLVHVARGEIVVTDTMNQAATTTHSGSSNSSAVVGTRNPQTLMPRY